MSRARQFLVAGGTFSVALGIGFVMQNGDALAARFSEATAPPGAQTAVPQAPMAEARVAQASGAPRIAQTVSGFRSLERPTLPAPEAIPVNFAVPSEADQVVEESTPITLAALESDVAFEPFENPVPETDGRSAEAAVCSTGLTAEAMPAALVALRLDAPCAPEMQATIHHQGMMFSILTDEAGQAEVIVPALAEAAVFMVDLPGQDGAVAVTSVPDLAQYDRAVLQWQGSDGPEIHALEFGADYGSEGHVWHGAGRDASVALAGGGGFLTRLGDPDAPGRFMAEVYTYPSGLTARDGRVDFTVETPVTAGNCGREVAAQTIQVSPGADPFSLDLSMNLPDCSAVGEFLIVRHLLLDLTVAAK